MTSSLSMFTDSQADSFNRFKFEGLTLYCCVKESELIQAVNFKGWQIWFVASLVRILFLFRRLWILRIGFLFFAAFLCRGWLCLGFFGLIFRLLSCQRSLRSLWSIFHSLLLFLSLWLQVRLANILTLFYCCLQLLYCCLESVRSRQKPPYIKSETQVKLEKLRNLV